MSKTDLFNRRRNIKSVLKDLYGDALSTRKNKSQIKTLENELREIENKLR